MAKERVKESNPTAGGKTVDKIKGNKVLEPRITGQPIPKISSKQKEKGTIKGTEEKEREKGNHDTGTGTPKPKNRAITRKRK